MAIRQFSIASGKDKTQVVEAAGASIGTDAVRIVIDDANAGNKSEVLALLEKLEQRIIERGWPLA